MTETWRTHMLTKADFSQTEEVLRLELAFAVLKTAALALKLYLRAN
ncbi:MAG: hypothetical protein ACTS68_00285 [Candidatus Hodgkinia cicadicola]